MPTIDSSALIGEGGKECRAWDGPVTDGALKTLIHRKNYTKDEVQPFTICYQDAASYFTVKVEIITCIHGHLKTVNNEPSRPATLLVLQYRLYPKPGHRFTSIKTCFTFKNVPRNVGATPSASPTVINYAPFPRSRLMQGSKQKIETDRGFVASLGIGYTPASANAGGHAITKKAHLQEFFATGRAGTSPDAETGVDNTVWWSLEENKLQKHGVLEDFRVAVLIERFHQDDFIGEFILDVYGTFNPVLDLKQRSKTALTRFLRRSELDDPVRFSPSRRKLQGKHDGIEPGSLLDLVQDTGDGDSLQLPESYHLENFLPSKAFIGEKNEDEDGEDDEEEGEGEEEEDQDGEEEEE